MAAADPGLLETAAHTLQDSNLIEHALEQRLDRLAGGGYWYEFNGLGVLVFASSARQRVLRDFGALASIQLR